MADVKVVRGTLGGVTVETSEENAERLGSTFEPEKPATKRAAAKSDSK